MQNIKNIGVIYKDRNKLVEHYFKLMKLIGSNGEDIISLRNYTYMSIPIPTAILTNKARYSLIKSSSDVRGYRFHELYICEDIEDIDNYSVDYYRIIPYTISEEGWNYKNHIHRLK